MVRWVEVRMVTGDLSCKWRIKDRLWYGDDRRRRGV